MASIADEGKLLWLTITEGYDQMRASWDLVLGILLNHQNYDDVESLFYLLLTEEERSAIASRLKVFQLLLEGDMSQRQIASEYEISIATITRCSNYLKNLPDDRREAITKLID